MDKKVIMANSLQFYQYLISLNPKVILSIVATYIHSKKNIQSSINMSFPMLLHKAKDTGQCIDKYIDRKDIWNNRQDHYIFLYGA